MKKLVEISHCNQCPRLRSYPPTSQIACSGMFVAGKPRVITTSGDNPDLEKHQSFPIWCPLETKKETCVTANHSNILECAAGHRNLESKNENPLS